MSDILLPGDAGFADVLSGKKFTSKNGYNIAGTMPVRTGATVGTLYPAAGHLDVVPLNGYYDGTTGSYVTLIDANFIAANIPLGMNVFGLAGTGANVKRWATGALTTTTATTFNITGLAFNPSIVMYYKTPLSGNPYYAVGMAVASADINSGGTGMKSFDYYNSGADNVNVGNAPVFGTGQVTALQIRFGLAGQNIKWYAFE
jgi:hypothetical protein